MYKKIFEALPHVDTIWVTDDGHFHLHNQNGGKEVTRITAFSVSEKTENKPKLIKNNNK